MRADLRVRRARLLTNDPDKIVGLEHHGSAVVERLPLQLPPHPANIGYPETKRTKTGHLLPPTLFLNGVAGERDERP